MFDPVVLKPENQTIKRTAKHEVHDETKSMTEDSRVIPGTAVKNLTASRWPWKQSCAWAMEQKGTNVPAVTLSLFSSP